MPGKQITLFDDNQWPGEAFGVSMPIEPQTTALGVIDVQHYALDSHSDAAQTVRTHNPQLQDDFVRRAAAMVENIKTLLGAFRQAGNRVFYTRHGMQLPDGGDLVERRRSREEIAHDATDGTAGHMPLKGEPGYDIVSAIEPRAGAAGLRQEHQQRLSHHADRSLPAQHGHQDPCADRRRGRYVRLCHGARCGRSRLSCHYCSRCLRDVRSRERRSGPDPVRAHLGLRHEDCGYSRLAQIRPPTRAHPAPGTRSVVSGISATDSRPGIHKKGCFPPMLRGI